MGGDGAHFGGIEGGTALTVNLVAGVIGRVEVGLDIGDGHGGVLLRWAS